MFLPKFLKYASILGVAACLTACQIGFPVPRKVFGPVTVLEKDGFHVTQAARTDVLSLGGFTVSTSGSYLSVTGEKRRVVVDGARHAWTLASDYLEVNVSAPEVCKSSAPTRAIARSGLTAVTSSAGGWPGRVQVSMHVLGEGAHRARFAVGLSGPRMARLAFEWRCAGDSDAWILAMASTALHEAVHAVLDLSRSQLPTREAMEDVAYGAEACFFVLLERSRQLTCDQSQRLRAHLDESIYASNPDSLERRCEKYRSHFYGRGTPDGRDEGALAPARHKGLDNATENGVCG